MKVTFIEHSGFCVELEHTILLFDYVKGKLPQLSKEKNLAVFVSHSHSDHYNSQIWDLKKKYENVRYVIAEDVPANQDAVVMKAHETRDILPPDKSSVIPRIPCRFHFLFLPLSPK